MPMQLSINKTEYTVDLKGHETLMEVLRNQLGLLGTKTACEESECGTCTVIINGKAVLSCITLAANVAGDKITTIEGLADGDNLHPIQQAFLDYGAVQCGFCIPGMIMSSKDLLDRNPCPTQEDIEYALDGNICRCAGYPKIFDAVREAGKQMQCGADSLNAQKSLKENKRIQLAEIDRGITYEEYFKSTNQNST